MSMVSFVTDTLGWRFLFALVLSVTLWARLTLEQNPERRDIYPTEISVEVRGLPNNLVVANDVQPVRLRIAAPQNSWRRFEPGVSFRALVDVSGVTPGLVQREVQVQVSDPDVQVLEVIPAEVSLRIEELRTASVPVRVNQLGSVPFGHRVVGEPVVTPPNVQVSGPSSAVEKVSEAAVSVQMDDIKSTVDRSLKPEPRGPGGVVTGVRLEPQIITVTLRVEQIAGSKAVSVVPQVRGQPAPGYWQGRITVEPATVQVVAEPSLLERITVLNTAEVDISGAEADVVQDVAIQRQEGVTVVPDQPATVRVAIQPLQGQQVRDIAVAVQNVGQGLTATGTPSVVSVTLSGPTPTLLGLTIQDIAATVDAAGRPAGTHILPVTVRVPAGLRLDRVSPERVTVVLTAPPTPPPAP
ncbi:MAG: CdaR family protein, partial [Chloroflexota bacterium]